MNRPILFIGLVLTCLALWSGAAVEPSVAAASSTDCDEPMPLAELVATSDMIAVATVDRRRLLLSNRTVGVNGLYAKIDQVLKRPFVEGFDLGALQFVRHAPKRYRLGEHNRAVVFLRLRPDLTWAAHECGVLPLDSNGTVFGACDAVSDLFGHDRFLRERRCLLAHPGSIRLSELETEIGKVKVHAHRFAGKVDVVSPFRWLPTQPFQRVAFKVRGVANKTQLVPFRSKGSEMSFTGYLPSEIFPEKEFAKVFQSGRVLHLEGTWFEGNFVVDSVRRR